MTGNTAPSSPTALIEKVPPNAIYDLHDSAGHTMDTVKVVADPTKAGRFLAVYHWYTGSTYDVGIATSSDLTHWKYARTLDTDGSQPYLAFSPAPHNGPILADETYTNSHLRFRYWTSVSGMLGAAAPFASFDAPRTLSTCAEGTPNITSVSYASPSSTITHGSTIEVSHHYFAGCKTDREAAGTLTNFKAWKTAALPAVDNALVAAGAVGKHGDRDTFSFGGKSWTLFEGQDSTAQTEADWRLYLYNGTTATRLDVTTPHGSTAFANPSVTDLTVGGVPSLLVSLFLPVLGAGKAEAGELLYWQPIPDPTPPATTTTTSAAPTTASIPPTTIAPTTTVANIPTTTVAPHDGNAYCGSLTGTPTTTKLLVIYEENEDNSTIIGNKGAPNINTYAKDCGDATDYTSLTHPSLPNYLASTSGLPYNTSPYESDCAASSCPTSNDNIFNQVGPSGWKGYAETMPAACYKPAADNAPNYYVSRHNPAVYYTDIPASVCDADDVVLGTNTAGALFSAVQSGSLATFSTATPNTRDDEHSGSLAQMDAWLGKYVPMIVAGPDYQSGRLAIAIVYDEGAGSGTNVHSVVPALFMSRFVKPGTTSNTMFTHYSLLKAAEDIAKVADLNNASAAANLRTAFHF